MIALDTKALVRALVDDDPKQAALAIALISRGMANGETFFVSDIVICEVVWVLSVSYKIDRTRIASLLRDLLRASHLQFRARDELFRALNAFGIGKGDFSDYLIREHASSAGADTVATFDKVLLREAGFMSVR
ncbi:MAG: type II toxin-antitoxin system VapC family toxin [Gemmatimonas sp.]